MEKYIIIFCILSGIGYTVFFLWYLTWPVVKGKVENISEIIDKGYLEITRPRKYRMVTYSYYYKNEKVLSSRQGLVTKRGFSPRCEVGDEILISVCKGICSLSCPRRVGFELLVLASLWALFIITALLVYSEM